VLFIFICSVGSRSGTPFHRSDYIFADHLQFTRVLMSVEFVLTFSFPISKCNVVHKMI
jgi:hypothetical protein